MNVFYCSLSLTILTMALLTGCSGTAETQSGTASSANVDSNPSDTAADSEDNAVANGDDETAAVSIPEDFPADIHIAEGAQSAEFLEIGGKENLILEYPASDDFVKNYLDGMAQQGWNQVASSELPIGTITNFSKDERKCTVSISPPKDNRIKVSIALTAKS